MTLPTQHLGGVNPSASGRLAGWIVFLALFLLFAIPIALCLVREGRPQAPTIIPGAYRPLGPGAVRSPLRIGKS